MSTILNTGGDQVALPVPVNKEMSCAVIVARWNSKITEALRDGALRTFEEAGVTMDNVEVIYVPGTIELVNAAAYAMRTHDAVIIIGCVIRGDTPHFDYVCHVAAEGTAILNAKGESPVIFGVLTCENMQQALDRAGGELGNKGSEAAVAAIEMANLHAASITDETA